MMSLIEITIGNSVPQTSILTTIFTGLAVALGGGVVLFSLNWLREFLMAKWNKHEDAEVLAFSLATELDRLVSECSDVVNDPQHQSDTGIWEPTVSPPVIVFSENLKWSAFPKSLHYRIRALPNKIDAANRMCGHLADYGDGPPDYYEFFEERDFRFAWIGLESSALRWELSKTYGVELLDRGEWDPDDTFKLTIERVTKKRADRDARWGVRDPFLPEVTMQELEARRLELGAGIAAAQARVKSPNLYR